MTFNPVNTLAPFLPTSTYFPEDFQQFRIKFLEIYRDIANTTNTRDNAVIDLREFVTGQQFFTSGDPQIKRYTFRKAFEIGAIAAGATSTVAHGITGVATLRFTHFWGSVIVDTGTYPQRPIPYVDAATVTNQIQVDADGTNYRIINGATAPDILSGILVLEYLKN